MTRQEIKALVLGLLIAAFLIWGIGFAFADPQTLEIPEAPSYIVQGNHWYKNPLPTPTPEAFSYHYRLSVGPDGTTVTMHAIEGGPTVKFSCINCGNLVGSEK